MKFTDKDAKAIAANMEASQRVIAQIDDLAELYSMLGEALSAIGRVQASEDPKHDESLTEAECFTYFYASTLLLALSAYISYRKRQPRVNDLRSIQLGMKLELEELHRSIKAKAKANEVKT